MGKFSRALSCLFLGGIISAVLGCSPVDRWQSFESPENTVVADDDGRPSSTSSLADGEKVVLPQELQGVNIGPELSVEMAVMYALQFNRDIKVQQLTNRITGAFEDIERGRFDPELYAYAQYDREVEGENTGSESKITRRDSTLEAGIRQSLPGGTTLDFGISQERRAATDETEEQQARLGLKLTQPLLRGAGTEVNLATVRQAQIDRMASAYELRGFVETLLAGTEIAYWQFVLATEKIAIFEQSLQVARKQRQEVELSIEVGLLPEFEAAAARAEEALRVQALIDAKSQLEESRLRLMRTVSPAADLDAETSLQAVSQPRMEVLPINDVAKRIEDAIASRAEMQQALLLRKRSRLETVMTRNGLLPRLDFFVNLGKTGRDTTLSGSVSAVDGDDYDFSAGLQLSHLLGNRKAEAEGLVARAEELKAEEALANLRQRIHYEVRLAINEVERLRQQITASHATRILQEQSLLAEEERFEVGASTALLIAQAQRDLLEAQIGEIEAVVLYRIALVRLYLAEGSLLERRGISLAADEGNSAFPFH